MVLLYFFVGNFWAAFSSMWRIAMMLAPSALPIMNAGLRFSCSVCGYLW